MAGRFNYEVHMISPGTPAAVDHVRADLFEQRGDRLVFVRTQNNQVVASFLSSLVAKVIEPKNCKQKKGGRDA